MMGFPCPPILSAPISPYQLLIALSAVVVMGCADTFTVRGIRWVFTPCQLPPCLYGAFKKCHFTPPHISKVIISPIYNLSNICKLYGLSARIGAWIKHCLHQIQLKQLVFSLREQLPVC
jgi:hypothetical protein